MLWPQWGYAGVRLWCASMHARRTSNVQACTWGQCCTLLIEDINDREARVVSALRPPSSGIFADRGRLTLSQLPQASVMDWVPPKEFDEGFMHWAQVEICHSHLLIGRCGALTVRSCLATEQGMLIQASAWSREFVGSCLLGQTQTELFHQFPWHRESSPRNLP